MSILTRFLGVWRRRRNEIEFKTCPFCGNDRWNFCINLDMGVYHCWACDAGGRISKLRGFLNLQGVDSQDTEIEPEESLLYLPSELSCIDTPGEKYLKMRGYDRKDILEWGILYDAKRHQIVFPLWEGEDLKYWVGKDILTERWYFPRGIKKKDLVWVKWGKETDHIILVEGIFDGMRVWRAGLSVLILLGKVVYPAHLKFLEMHKIRPVIFFDGDCTYKDYERIPLEDFEWMRCPRDKDPDDLEESEILELFQKRKVFSLRDRLELRLQC